MWGDINRSDSEEEYQLVYARSCYSNNSTSQWINTIVYFLLTHVVILGEGGLHF